MLMIPAELYSIDFSTITIVLMAASLLMDVVILLFLIPKLKRVRQAASLTQEQVDGAIAAIPSAGWPSVSVIVHSSNDSGTLETLIPMILAQEYAGQMEVIIVNDGKEESVSDTVSRFEEEYRNIYMTYLPARSRNLSRRKLAITLGVKAARFDTVVFLPGSARLRSEKWLSLMMLPIAKGADISVGYGYPAPLDQDPDNRPGRHRLISFEQVRTAVQYLGAAITGHLYRAFSNNLAYRRDLFFKVGGFTNSIGLRYGDDDIFIASIGRGSSYGVQLAPEAIVEIAEPSVQKAHRRDKLVHDYTGRFVSRREPLMWGALSWMWWIWLGTGTGAIVSALPSLVPALAVTVLNLAFCLPLGAMWRKTSEALCGRRLMLTVPWFMLAQPFYTLCYRMMGRRRRSENFNSSSPVA